MAHPVHVDLVPARELVVPRGIFTQHVAVLGKTRSGKSSVMRYLVEDLLERRQPVCIVDPKGDWWGLKLMADGKRAGFPVVIFGGEHADIPITPHVGAEVAELWATGNRSCLVDLGGWTVEGRTRFWIDFASTLFRTTKGQRWLVVDEIHNFAPKGKVFDPSAGKALHWTNRLASEGLGKGVALLFASQRPQKVHNDTLTSAETLIAMRVLHPSDRGAVSDWIKGNGDAAGAQVLGTLADLARGEAWVWSPEIKFGPTRLTVPLFQTYDSFRPQTAADASRLKGWAAVDLDEVRAKLAAVVEEAKANDPGELRRQMAEKDRRIKELEAGVSISARLNERAKPEVREVLTDSDRELLRAVSSRLTALPDELDGHVRARVAHIMGQAVDQATKSADDLAAKSRAEFAGLLEKKGLQRILETLDRVSAPPAPAPRFSVPGSQLRISPSTNPGLARPGPTRDRVAKVARAVIDQQAGDLDDSARKILDVCAALGKRNIMPSRETIARWLDIHPNGGRYGSNLATLRARGLLDGVELTPEGRALARTIPTGLEALKAPLDGSQRELVDVLDTNRGKRFSRETLALTLGIHQNGGRYGSNLARLRTMGVIPDRGDIYLLDTAYR